MRTQAAELLGTRCIQGRSGRLFDAEGANGVDGGGAP